MPLDAFVLALAAAAIHAGWNVLLAGAADTRAATAGALTLVAAACLPVAALTWDAGGRVVPFLVASVVLETAYFALLAAAYARADLGVVYPIARGAAPVLVLVAAALAGRGDPTALQAAGVLLVAAGVVALRGGRAPAAARDVLLSLAVGAAVAGYVLVDDAGLEHAATIPYLCVVVGVPGAIYAGVFAAQAGVPALRRHVDARAAGVAAGMVAAFGLALAALELADPAPVAAIREASVVIAALAAPRLLGERGGARRVAGAVAVFAGVAAVAAG
jgi:drug/metabolite transporter (DMT)-like permease